MYNQQIVKYQVPFHFVIRLTGKPEINPPVSSKPTEEKPKDSFFTPVFKHFQKHLEERKLQAVYCSITNNRVKMSFDDSNDKLLANTFIKDKLIQYLDKNTHEFVEMTSVTHKYDAELEVELSHKLTLFSIFFKEFKEVLLNHTWFHTSFHWSEKNGLSTKLTAREPQQSQQKCDVDVEFIENSLSKHTYDIKHAEITTNSCSIELKKNPSTSENK